MIDLGMVAKVRPCVLLTDYPPDDELALVTVLPHTTALRGNRWELAIPKPFLKPGAFHLQQIQSVSVARLERRLGALTAEEWRTVQDRLADFFPALTDRSRWAAPRSSGKEGQPHRGACAPTLASKVRTLAGKGLAPRRRADGPVARKGAANHPVVIRVSPRDRDEIGRVSQSRLGLIRAAGGCQDDGGLEPLRCRAAKPCRQTNGARRPWRRCRAGGCRG